MESTTKNKQTEKDIIKMVQKAFRNDLSTEQIMITELTEGFFNVAYEVVLPDQTVILKIAPPTTAKIMSYENNIMRSEVDGLRLVKEKTAVPVPKVLFYDDTRSICDADYFFMEKLEGESFYKLKSNGMPQEEVEMILEEVGRLNHEMNQIKGNIFGYIGQEEKQGASWKETFLSMIFDILADGEKIEISLGMDYDKVRSLLEKASFALEPIQQSVFVHWDLWDGNVFVKDGKITGIIDFERALWGDPLMEYYFRHSSYNKDFIRGYDTDLRAEAPIRALIYDIYLYLIMVIETKYRNYPDDWQYNFATKELYIAVEELNKLVE
jgi:aminoglycoside phosphotransferase (APT) family kinase protein